MLGKNLKFIFIFAILFLAQSQVALAEVTCCACSNTTGHASFSPHTDVPIAGTERSAISFECQDGLSGCEEVCTGGAAGSRPLGTIRATGEVVTCCECANEGTRVCNGANQTCDTLCSSNGGFTDGDPWRRYPEAPTETTKDEAAKVELIPPVLNIDIPGTSNLFGGGQIVTEGEKRYFYLPFIGQYVSALYNYVLGIVGILAVVVIIFAGVIWLTAGGSPERIKTAQEYIFGAVTGVVLAFGSYLILYTINPDLVRFGAMKIEVIERILLPEPVISVGSENPSDPGDGGEYEIMARRIAEEYDINGCLFATQIGMESRWNPNSSTSCCYGLGQILWRNASSFLSRNRAEIIEKHSQGCPRCPQGDASQEEIGRWLMEDPEGNLIIAAMLKRNSLGAAPNPVAAVSIYGMGAAAYNSYVQNGPCTPQRFSEDELLERIRSGISTDDLITQSCIPPNTWPLTDTSNSTRSCPTSNQCCRANTGTCEQPAYSPQGRIGVCQGGPRNNQRCIAIAGGVNYIRSYLNTIQRCAREE